MTCENCECSECRAEKSRREQFWIDWAARMKDHDECWRLAESAAQTPFGRLEMFTGLHVLGVAPCFAGKEKPNA